MTNEFGRAASGAVTKAELDQRIAARLKPRAEQESERRIRQIDERLKQARESFKQGYARSLQRGRAKQEFDRGR